MTDFWANRKKELEKRKKEGAKTETSSKAGVPKDHPPMKKESKLAAELKGIQNILHGLDLETKLKIKERFVNFPAYAEHAAAFAKSDSTVQDRIFQFYVISLGDLGLWNQFFEMADRAIELRQIPEPSLMKKSFEEFRAWTFSDWAEAMVQNDCDPDEQGFLTKILEEPKRLPEEAHKRLLACKFKSLLAQGDKLGAVAFGDKAVEQGAKIKTKLAEIKKELEG